jgi:hypothetical protein
MVENNLKKFLRSLNEHGWHIDIGSEIGHRFAILMSIKNEVNSILVQVELLKKIEKNQHININTFPKEEKLSIRQALWYSILVRYFKIFANASKSPGYISLSLNHHLKGASEELKDFHEYLKDIRDKHMSHGIDYNSQQMITRIFYEVDMRDGELGFRPAVIGIKRISCSDDELQKIAALLNLLLQNIEPIIIKAQEALNDEVQGMKFTAEQIEIVKELYEIALEVEEYKAAIIPYIINEHFKLPNNRKTEKRITLLRKEEPNQEFYWLDYGKESQALILDIRFFPYGDQNDTFPFIETCSPSPIPKFNSLICKHRIKNYGLR